MKDSLNKNFLDSATILIYHRSNKRGSYEKTQVLEVWV